MPPSIGLTASFTSIESKPSPRERDYLNAAYADAVFAAGGVPVILPPPAEPTLARLDALLDSVDGLIFTGGDDLDPHQYGDPSHPLTEAMHARRGAFEVAFFRRADERRRPILAICLGFQVAHVARGGGLIQHVDELRLEPRVTHHMPDHSEAYHGLRVAADSHLAKVLGATVTEVNSRHHQAVDPDRLGRGLRSVAWSPDGLVEASEDMGASASLDDGRFLLAVQWHPEDLLARPEQLHLFEALVAAAGALAARRVLSHER